MYSLRSYTFSLHGYGSRVETDISEAIHTDAGQWRIGVLGFHAFNTVKNVIDKKNNVLTYWAGNRAHTAVIPEGNYDLEALQEAFQEALPEGETLVLHGENATQRIQLYSTARLDFRVPGSPAGLLGFPSDRVLHPDFWHESSEPIELLHFRLVRLHCNVVSGSFEGTGQPSTILHEFSPKTPPGFKIIEEPQNVVYLPINTPRISHIVVDVTDERNRPLDFGTEHRVDVRLHLQRWV
jgi:hypothetical protein